QMVFRINAEALRTQSSAEFSSFATITVQWSPQNLAIFAEHCSQRLRVNPPSSNRIVGLESRGFFQAQDPRVQLAGEYLAIGAAFATSSEARGGGGGSFAAQIDRV